MNRNDQLTEEQIDEIVHLYKKPKPNGMYRSQEELGEMFDRSGRTIGHHLRNRGVEPHKRRYAPPGQADAPECKCGCGKPVEWGYDKGGYWYKYIDGHQFPERPYHNRDWLYEQYIEQHKSVQQIAEEINCGATTVCRYLKKHGIPSRTTGETLALNGSVRGENNPAWKGGVANWDYAFNWRTEIMPAIRKRDNYTCQLCGTSFDKRSKRLHVHHIDEDKTNNHPHNLIALCVTCHFPLHGDESKRAMLVKIAKGRPETEYRH